MKKLLLFTISIIGTCQINAQNLVPNPGFEIYTLCPTTDGQINRAAPWMSSDATGTPDFMTTCGTGGYSQPTNSPGFQAPHTDSSYAGFFATVGSTFGLSIREYMQAPLITPLVANQVYTVTFFVSLSDVCNYGASGIGAYFTSTPITTPNPVTGSITPQISNPVSNIVTSKTQWTQITGTFTAAGGEQYITIGNFKTNANSGLTNVGGGSIDDAYFYIDDISVTAGPTGILATTNENQISIFPNPVQDRLEINLNNSTVSNGFISITNIQGELIYSEQFENTNSIAISTDTFSEGLYFVSILTSEEKFISKFIKKN